jgi:hypothetical protein
MMKFDAIDDPSLTAAYPCGAGNPMAELAERPSARFYCAERWPSGRRHQIANLAYWVTGTEGSNPSLSANESCLKYVDLISDFGSGGILELQLLRPIGSELGSHYLLLPGLAEFDQTIMDKYDFLGVKLVRTRVTTLRLWLQLWDTQTGRILWESAGELTAATALLSAKRTVPLEKLAQELWLEMIQEDLLEGRTETRLFRRIRE